VGLWSVGHDKTDASVSRAEDGASIAGAAISIISRVSLFLWLAPVQAHNWCGEWSELGLLVAKAQGAHTLLVLAAIIRYP
jgi:hypothetical protein